MPALYLIQSGAFDTAGQAANKIEDASAGMQKQPDSSGNVWAWNPRAGQWMRIVVQKADGTTILSTLAKKFYNDANRWREIAQLAENNPIVGDMGDKAIPGDTILIPNLQQPFNPPSGVTPTGGSATDTPVAIDVPPAGGGSGVLTIPAGLPNDPPAGWPSGLPWPGSQPGSGVGPTPIPTGDVPTPIGTSSNTPPEKTPTGMTTTSSTSKDEEKFWTPTKIAVAGVAGTALVVGVIFLATRKKRRRRR